MFFDPPFPLLVPPDPHIHFLLQEGEQVLPRPFLPHHCALQVCGEGLWDGREQDSPGPRALGRGIPDSCPSGPRSLRTSPRTLLPVPLTPAIYSPWAKFSILCFFNGP